VRNFSERCMPAAIARMRWTILGQARENGRAERLRLLYVAMTRAEKMADRRPQRVICPKMAIGWYSDGRRSHWGQGRCQNQVRAKPRAEMRLNTGDWDALA